MFLPGTEETRTARILLPGGPFEFGYVVEACWAKPAGPVTDPETDFPPEANCHEAYQMSISFDGVFDTVSDPEIPFTILVYDHQGRDTVTWADVHFIDGWSASTDYVGTNADGGLIYQGKLWDTGEPPGTYAVVLRVRPNEAIDDGSVEYGYNIIPIEVSFEDHDPVAEPSCWPNPQTVSRAVYFYDDGSYDPDEGDIVKWEWDWESDGTYDAEGEIVTHTFDTAGDHEVTPVSYTHLRAHET